ncbi:transposase [Laribacter hongkongensis]|nr:transposase [Laribacter hongkongensis]
MKIHWLQSLNDARDKVERWRQGSNEFRPYSSLDDWNPAKFVLRPKIFSFDCKVICVAEAGLSTSNKPE